MRNAVLGLTVVVLINLNNDSNCSKEINVSEDSNGTCKSERVIEL